ncbi:hypothetical protein ABT009_18070 [Streptomyces sp. NPDC002896]|uniref:hypothetical protein n=1 Tax=Streptomyces sp. NPDC002896 TaxID=3154438 RepID=UPI00332FB789
MSYYRASAATSRSDRKGNVFAFTRAWAVGVVVLAVSEYVQMSLVYDTFVGPRGPRSFGGAVLLVHLPNLVCLALATWAAAHAHPEPHRDHLLRHATAAFAVPAAAQLLTLALSWNRPGFGALDLGMSSAVLLAGCAVGWAAERWQGQRDG